MKPRVLVAAVLLMGAAPAQDDPPAIVRTPAKQATAIGDWFVEDHSEYVGAFTNNERGAAFGTLCGEVCVSYVTSPLSCTKDEQYWIFANSPSGAFPISATCDFVGEYPLLVFPLSPETIEAMDIGGSISIVSPDADSGFVLDKFSLTGAERASSVAASIADGRKKERTQLRDFNA